jgi:hypothetical protein
VRGIADDIPLLQRNKDKSSGFHIIGDERIILLSIRCSMIRALQPEVRAMTKRCIITTFLETSKPPTASTSPKHYPLFVALGADDPSEEFPAFTSKTHKLQLLKRSVIGRRSIEFDPR